MDSVLIPGIALYTYHKYQKSISDPIPLDAHGLPVDEEGGEERHFYARARTSQDSPRVSTANEAEGMTLTPLRRSPNPSSLSRAESSEERAARLRDDFEGWDRADDDWSDAEAEEEAGLDEVAQRREEREHGTTTASREKSWGPWWDKSM